MTQLAPRKTYPSTKPAILRTCARLFLTLNLLLSATADLVTGLRGLRAPRQADLSADCHEHGSLHLCKLLEVGYKGGSVPGTRWELGMALPFTFSTTKATSLLPDLLRLPGPCTVTTVPAWGCPSNIFELRRVPNEEMTAFCSNSRVFDHPVIFVYRNYFNMMHWLSDQVIPYFLTLEEFDLTDTPVQIITLDEGAYHIQTPENLANREDVWRQLTGTDPIDWADHVGESFCAKTAILGNAGHITRDYNVELPLPAILKERPHAQKLGSWILSKYNLSHPAAIIDAANPVVHVIDRFAEKQRRILNQHDIVRIAKTMTQNSRLVKLERIGFREQLELLSGTDILIGSHGAGLGMAALLPPWGVLVELKPYGYGTINRDFYMGFCNWARLLGIQYMGWHNTDRSRTRQAGGDPMYFKNFHTRMTEGDITWVVQSAMESTRLQPGERQINECTQLNEPVMPDF